VNKVLLLGKLGKNPEIRYTSAGMAVVNFNLATTEGYKNKSTDKWENKTTWHRIAVFGKQAETVSKNLFKGSTALVIGKITVKEWTDKDNNKRTSI